MHDACLPGCALRTKLCDILAAGGMDDTVVERIRNDDQLVSQTFFWSGPGMKLFGELTLTLTLTLTRTRTRTRTRTLTLTLTPTRTLALTLALTLTLARWARARR